MARKVIIDCDPGIDDAVALTIALFDPRLEILAVTATAGNVTAEQASRNVQAIIERLDPPRFPRVGTAAASEAAPSVDGRRIHGDDGLGNAGFAVSQLHHQHPSEKVICDAVRAAPNEVSIICLGPLTNVARAFQRDPELPRLVHRLIMMGGSVSGVGNVTPSAEFNIFLDPASALSVFRSKVTKTLVPLDVTSRLRLTLDFMDQLPADTSRAGAVLRLIVPHLFRSFHQTLGQESFCLHDVVALMAAVEPELFETKEMAGEVETSGQFTSGMTVFDRRPKPEWRPNMEVVLDAQIDALETAILRGLRRAGEQS
jgi:purine nucleosidase